MMPEFRILRTALEWHLDAGVDAIISDRINPMLASPVLKAEVFPESKISVALSEQAGPVAYMGAGEAKKESSRRAHAANTLHELRQAIETFDGLSLRQTAITTIFADGNPSARIMVVADVPNSNDDRTGKPLSGTDGVFFDRMMKAAGLSREGPEKHALYMVPLIPWRPPGNRTPTNAELAVCLPFLERHIQLIKPDILITLGTLPARTLTGSTETLSRLRGKWHSYLPLTLENPSETIPIPLMTLLHPDFLQKTPMSKRQVWSDLLKIMEKIENIS